MSRYIAYAAFFLTSLSVQGTELLVNGGFETGDFTGWLATARLTSGGELLVFDGTTSPLNGVYSLTGPREGDWFALIDQGIGPGSYALTQTFTVPVSATKVTLRFSFFAQNGHFETIIGPGLDHTGAPNQHAAIDLIAGDAGPFTDVVLRNFYKGADTVDGEAATYTDYVFDITSNVVPGGTYQIRAGQADNQFFFQSGFDNVSVGAQVVPEPSTAMLFGLAVICFGLLGRKRLRRPKFQCGHRWILQLCFIASITADIASALPISFDFKLMGSYKSQSLLSLRDISSWNGQPISDTNKPTDFNRKLEATTNMYVTPSFKNILFVQVTDVTTTEGWPAASASANIALTGIEFWLPSLNGKDLGIPLFSSDYANQGQRIIGPNGTATTPTEVTDGFDFFQGQSNGGYAIHTPNYTDNLAFGLWVGECSL